jgi:hypothetical protein
MLTNDHRYDIALKGKGPEGPFNSNIKAVAASFNALKHWEQESLTLPAPCLMQEQQLEPERRQCWPLALPPALRMPVR